MKEFQQRRKIKRRIYSWPVVIVLILVLLLLIEGTWKVYQKERESATNLSRMNSQLADLNSRNTALSNDVAQLQTDQGVENEIRSKYEVSKPGEQVLIIVDKNNSTSSSATTSVWMRLWSGFLGLFKRN